MSTIVITFAFRYNNALNSKPIVQQKEAILLSNHHYHTLSPIRKPNAIKAKSVGFPFNNQFIQTGLPTGDY